MSMELNCEVQNYEWGKRGFDSYVSFLIKNVEPDFSADLVVPYAELWMGTHVNGPSVVKNTGEKLSDYIAKNPNVLGDEVIHKFGQLPFLFKVLSIDKALSIQVHPNKEQAEILHSKFPEIYKDPNHKPELAIALTPFEALCGFRPASEIRHFIKEINELQNVVGSECLNICDDVEFMKITFKSVLSCSKEKMQVCIDSLLNSFKKDNECQRTAKYADIVERLHTQFPYDNGILMIYFLNFLRLNPYEAIYLGANEPHAYLGGDCVECMACSDNVVRAGLTPKLIDKDTLCSMLVYKGESPDNKLFPAIAEGNFTNIYRPPVSDFAVAHINVTVSTTEFKPSPRNSASILLVVAGRADYTDGVMVPGTILFLAANQVISVTNIMENMIIFQAFANL